MDNPETTLIILGTQDEGKKKRKCAENYKDEQNNAHTPVHSYKFPSIRYIINLTSTLHSHTYMSLSTIFTLILFRQSDIFCFSFYFIFESQQSTGPVWLIELGSWIT